MVSVDMRAIVVMRRGEGVVAVRPATDRHIDATLAGIPAVGAMVGAGTRKSGPTSGPLRSCLLAAGLRVVLEVGWN